LYRSFRHQIVDATRPNELIAAFVKLLPALDAEAVAVFRADMDGYRYHGRTKSASVDMPRLCTQFIDLWRNSNQPLSHSLRLNPHPIALSDLRNHPRLLERSRKLIQLLAQHNLNDAFLVPATDQQINAAVVVVVGRDMNLRPTRRHLVTQAATDVVSRLHAPPPRAQSFNPPPHLQLTARQLEVSTWLIAGKTDWEIGEILKISPKTVNFHVENIKRAYGVKSRNQFVAAIVHDGGLAPHPVSSSLPAASPGELSST